VFTIRVGDLLRHPGERRKVELRGALADVGGSGASVAGDVDAELTLEALPDAMVAVGTVRADWTGECRRCLGPATGIITAVVRELFEVGSDEEETYRLDRDEVDVTPLVRDAVLLELPLAPLCREACRGLCPVCGANLNDADCGCERTDRDPRWAALDQLKE
jgi:uncharacterized protein